MKDVIRKIKRINTSLPDILVGILLYGILLQIIGSMIVSNLFFYSIALWIGNFLSMAMAFHMALALNRGLCMEESGAEKLIRSHSFIRYAVIIIVLGIIMFTDVLNPLIVFLGIMSLKVAAYLQPITHKLIIKLFQE